MLEYFVRRVYPVTGHGSSKDFFVMRGEENDDLFRMSVTVAVQIRLVPSSSWRAPVKRL